MLSIIICSRKPIIDSGIEKNIRNTIGAVEYEIIWIDNSGNSRSIFQAYNEGVQRAKYDLLCFMHEDVEMHTHDWGSLVSKHLNRTDVGVIGVYGSYCMPDVFPLEYWNLPCTGNLLQGYSSNGKYYCKERKTDVPQDGEAKEVVVVDGLWFCCRKELFNEARFDDATFCGFHCYDLDICMQARELGKKVMVVYDILMEHKSMGSVSRDYYSNLKTWYGKWSSSLPASVLPYDIDYRSLLAELYVNGEVERRQLLVKYEKFSNNVVARTIRSLKKSWVSNYIVKRNLY